MLLLYDIHTRHFLNFACLNLNHGDRGKKLRGIEILADGKDVEGQIPAGGMTL